MFEQFFELADFDHRFSSSFISLIPKNSCPSSLDNFRPIFTMGWVHRLISLKGVVGKLVRDIQSRFIKKRGILMVG